MKTLLNSIVKKMTKNYITSEPRATRQQYLMLHDLSTKEVYPEIVKLEGQYGYVMPNDYFENLAVHTQVCVKKSKLNYQHGKILYIFLRKYLEDNFESQNMNSVNVFETGTARGFSSICMARAIIDSGKNGHILTCDVIPHSHSMYWNCIDDLSGKKTREQLLQP